MVVVLAGLTPEAYAQNDWAARNADSQAAAFEPGVVWIRFTGGQSPPAGWDPSGLGGIGTSGDSFQITGVRQAFPQLEAYARKRPLTPTMVWLQGVYEMAFSGPAAPQTVAQVLARSPDIELAEPQPMYRVQDATASGIVAPNDARYATHQAYLGRMKLEEAWDVVKGESGSVVIATVDIGLDISHEDHRSNLWTNAGEIAGNGIDDDNNGYVDDINGWNFTTNRGNPSPDHAYDDHGTQVAGAANASTNNSVGVAGAAWNAKTMGIQAQCQYRYLLCYSTEGIIYAYSNGADIINASWGSYNSYSTVEHAAIKSAFEAGALVVAAAGNETINNDNRESFPTNYPEVLGVGATGATSDEIASFSNYGRSVHIFAPGIDIETTGVYGTYDSVEGTSLSAPLVAGIAALLKTLRNSWGPGRIREHLRLTADNIDAANSSDYAGLLGRGRVNAYRAVTESEKPGVRLESTTVTDANGNNAFEAGEEITVSATFTNHGGAGSNISIGFTNADPHISWNTQSRQAGAMQHGDSYTGAYTFTVQPSVPAKHSLRLITSITEGSFSDSPDFVDLSFYSYARSAAHTTPSIRVSFLDSGNIGHLEHAGSPHNPGIGFQVLQSGGTWEDYLYEGGLVVGRGPSQVMSSVRGSNGGYEQDFAAGAGSYPQIVDPGQVGSQDGSVTLTESSTSSAGLSLEIIMQSYTYNAAESDDFIILHYTLTNTGQSALNGVYAGLYLDWAIGTNPYSNDAGFDTGRNVGYITESGSSTRFAGARLLSDTGNLSYAALDDESEPTGYDFTDAEKWALLSGGIGTTTQSSVLASQFIAAGPIDVGGNGSEEVVFALVTGQSLSSLLSNADAAYREWSGFSVALSASPSTVHEGAGATTVTVTATSQVASDDATVLPITVTGSGTAGVVGFAAVPDFNLTLPAGATTASATFTLTPSDDQVDQSDETITIKSSSPLVTQSASLTLTDDDATPGITLSADPTTVSEGDGATTVTVTGTVTGGTTFGTAQSIPLTVSGTGSSDVVGFTPVTGVALPIAAGATSGTTTFTLIPTDNQTAESDETVTISSSSTLVANAAAILLQDDDAGTAIQLSVDPATVSEGAGATTVTVTATSSSTFADAQVLSIEVTGSEAAGVVMFAPVNDFDLTLAAGATTGIASFTLTPTDNEVDEADETITISSSSVQVAQSVTLALADDDATPSVSLSVNPESVSEGDGDVTITVVGELSGATTFGAEQSIALTIDGSGDSDVVGFTPVTGVELLIAAQAGIGETTFTLSPTDNETVDAEETITIGSPSTLVANAVTITLYDDDGPPEVHLSVSPSSVGEGDGETNVTVTATINRSLADAQVLPIAVAGSGANGVVGFAPVADFELALDAGAAAGTVTFALTPTDDQVDEANETITISSSNALVTRSAALTLIDDDATPSIVLSVVLTTMSEGDGPTSVTVTGTVTGGTTFGAAQSVVLTVVGSGASDVVGFAPVTGVVLPVWTQSTTGQTTFTLTPTDNQIEEADETITISSPSALVSNAVTIILRDDDRPVTIRLSASPASVGEGDGPTSVTVTVTSSAAFADTQVLPIAVAGSGALEAVDFAAVSGFDLSLPAGETTATGSFTLIPTDDVVDEVQDSLWITSTSPTVVDSALVLLTDDDRMPDGVVLNVTPDIVHEDDGATTITVTASVSGSTRYASGKVMNLSVTGSGLANPVDFVAVPGFSLSIPAESASGTGGFVLSPQNDEEGESDETITIRSDSIFVLTDAVLVLRDDDGGITHADPDEEIPPLRIAPPYPNPAVGRVTFVVSLSAPADRASLCLYNTLGQQVAVPFKGALGAGEHTVHFDGQRLPAGVYMYVFASPGARITGYLVMAQ